ncbi:MAG: glycosyltransferase family 4 protein, partial [Candidatus Omnitrophota bacterium]
KVIRERDDLIKMFQDEAKMLSAWGQAQNNKILEYDGQISILNQIVAARDAQIVELNKAVSERDKEIAGFLIQQVKGKHKKIFAIIKVFARKFKDDALFISRSFHYLQKNGIKKSFLAFAYKIRQRRPTAMLTLSTRSSLQNILNHLGVHLESKQVLAALIDMFGQKETERIMSNIVDVEKFIFTKNSSCDYPIIHTSQLPAPSSKTRKRKILFITAEFPNCHHGGGNRVLNFIKALSADNDIYLCTIFFPQEHKRFFPEVDSSCRDILKIPYDRFGGNQDEIRKWLGPTTIDIVHYEWPRSLENYAADFGKIQIFTFMEAVSWRLLADMKRLAPLSTTWLKKLEELAYTLRLEFVQASKMNARIAVTENDAKFFSELFPFQEYAVLNHGLDFNEFSLPDVDFEPHTLTFVGNYMHYPNAEAMEFFLNEIWGRILKQIPDARIYIVGTNPDGNLRHRSDGKQIIVTGTVADVRPYIQKASVCIAPLISGTGLRGKVIEYAALHRPFVATSIASAGLIFKDGIDYFRADTARDFSDKIIALLKDPQLAKKMAENAYVAAR